MSGSSGDYSGLIGRVIVIADAKYYEESVPMRTKRTIMLGEPYEIVGVVEREHLESSGTYAVVIGSDKSPGWILLNEHVRIFKADDQRREQFLQRRR